MMNGLTDLAWEFFLFSKDNCITFIERVLLKVKRLSHACEGDIWTVHDL